MTCVAQGRGARRFSSASVEDALAEEDVVLKNHRFQTRHGTRTEPRGNEVPAAKELPSRGSNISEVASTRRSTAPRGDNEITRTPSRTGFRQRTEPSTTRQFLSRNSKPTETSSRRRIDNEISTEEVFTRGSIRTRPSAYTGRGTIEQESTTTAHYRGRGRVNNQQERPASQIRSRNGNVRQPELNQSRAGRGRSLAHDESTTQSLRTRGRVSEKAIVTDGRTYNARISDGRSNNIRLNEGSRVANSRNNDQKVSDIAIPVRTRGRNGGRGRTISRTESFPAPVGDTISTKLAEEISVSSSDIPLESSSQDQLTNVDGTQGLEVPLVQPLEEVSSDEVPLEQSTKKANGGNGITSESALAVTEERIKEISTIKATTEHAPRPSGRGRVRIRNGISRTNEYRTSESADYEASTRSNRRNSLRHTLRPTTSSRSTVERPAGQQTGRGRFRDYNTRADTARNSRTEPEITTSNYRVRYQNNIPTSSTARALLDDQTQTYETTPTAVDKTVNNDFPTAVEGEQSKTFTGDSELQANNDNPTTSDSTTTKQAVTSEHSVPSLLARKLGRGSARASTKTEALRIKKERSDEVSDDDNYPEVYKQLKKSGTNSKDILGTQQTDKIEKIREDEKTDSTTSTSIVSSPKSNFKLNFRKNLLNRKLESSSTQSIIEKDENINEQANSYNNRGYSIKFNKNQIKESKNVEQSEESGKDSSDLSGRRANFRNRFKTPFRVENGRDTREGSTKVNGLYRNSGKQTEVVEENEKNDKEPINERRFTSSRFKSRNSPTQTTEKIIQEIIQRNIRLNSKTEQQNKPKTVDIEPSSQIEKAVHENKYTRRQFPTSNKDRYTTKFTSKDNEESLQISESDRTKENIYSLTRAGNKENNRYPHYERKLKFGNERYNHRRNEHRNNENQEEHIKDELTDKSTTNRMKSDINGLLDKLERLALTERTTNEKLDKPVYTQRNRVKELEKFTARTDNKTVEQDKIIESNKPIKTNYELLDTKNEIIYNRRLPSIKSAEEKGKEEDNKTEKHKHVVNTRRRTTNIPYVPSIQNFIKSSTTPLPLSRLKSRRVSLEKLLGETEDLTGDTSENHGLTIIDNKDGTNFIPNTNRISIDSLVSESEISIISTEADEYTRKKPLRKYQQSHIQRVPSRMKETDQYTTSTQTKLTSTLTTTGLDYEPTVQTTVVKQPEEHQQEENIEKYITSERPYLTNEILLIVPTTFSAETKTYPTTNAIPTTAETVQSNPVTATTPAITTNLPTTTTTRPIITTTLPTITSQPTITTAQLTITTTQPITTTTPTTTTTTQATTTTHATTTTTQATTTTTHATTTTTTTTQATTTTKRTTPKPTTKATTKSKPKTTKATTIKPTTKSTTPKRVTTTKKQTTTTAKPTTTTTKSTTTTTTPKPTTTQTTTPSTIKTTKHTAKKPTTTATTTTTTTTTNRPIKKRTTTATVKSKTVVEKPTTTTTTSRLLPTEPAIKIATTPFPISSALKAEQSSTQRIVTILSTLAVLIQNFTTPSPNQYGELNTADVRALIENTTRSTPPPTRSTAKPTVTSDYQVYGLLPNNNLVRKRTTEPPRDLPFIIYGLYPNGTIVRRFPNGTIIPEERLEEENEVVASIEPGNRASLENVIKKDNQLSYLYPEWYSTTPTSFTIDDYTQRPFVTSTPYRIDLNSKIVAKETVIQKVNTPKFTSLPMLTNNLVEIPTTTSYTTIIATTTTERPNTVKITQLTTTTTVKTTKKPATTKPTRKTTTQKVTAKPKTKPTTTKPTTTKPTTTKPTTTKKPSTTPAVFKNVYNTTKSLTSTTSTVKPKSTVKPQVTTKTTSNLKSSTTKAPVKTVNKTANKLATTRQTTTLKTTPNPKSTTTKTTVQTTKQNNATTVAPPTKSKTLTTRKSPTTTTTVKTKPTSKTTTVKPTTVQNKTKKKQSASTTPKTTKTTVKSTTEKPRVTAQDLADLEILSKVLDSDENNLASDISKSGGGNLAKEVIELAIERALKSTTTAKSKVSLKEDLQTLSSTSAPVVAEFPLQGTTESQRSNNNKNGKISLWVIPQDDTTTERTIQSSASNEVDILNILLSTPTAIEKLSPQEQLLLAAITGGLGGAGTTPQGGLFRPIIPSTAGQSTDGSAAFGTFGAESVNDVVNSGTINTANLDVRQPEPNPRSGLIGAAINVSRAVSQFMGYVIQGATQSFQNYLQTRTRALAQAIAYPPAS